MKLCRKCVKFLDLVVTSRLSNGVSCDEHCTLAKVWSLVDIGANALCDELTVNLV